MQVAGALQVPLELHVSTPLLTHWVVPGMHEPVHAPDTHAWFTHAVALCHVPDVVHVCGCVLDAHCVCPWPH